MKQWIAPLLVTCVLCASGYAQTFNWTACHRRARTVPNYGVMIQPQVQVAPAPQVQAVPVPPAPAPLVIPVPATVIVQTSYQTTSLRWGFFNRRLVPRTAYQLGPQLTYTLQQTGQ